MDEIETVGWELAGTPLLFNWAQGGKTPPVPYERLQELGFRIVIFPLITLLAATQAMRHALPRMPRRGHRPRSTTASLPSTSSSTSSDCPRWTSSVAGSSPSRD